MHLQKKWVGTIRAINVEDEWTPFVYSKAAISRTGYVGYWKLLFTVYFWTSYIALELNAAVVVGSLDNGWELYLQVKASIRLNESYKGASTHG